jgi:hypothetical protein
VHGDWGRAGTVEDIRKHIPADAEFEFAEIGSEAAVNLIRGGVAWARQHHHPLPADYELWLRLVDPAPAWGLDLGVFGDGGRALTRDEAESGLYSRSPLYLPATPDDAVPTAEALGGLWARPAALWVPGAEVDETADEAPLPAAPPRPTLWLPGDDLTPPEDEDEVPRPGGLWLPGQW